MSVPSFPGMPTVPTFPTFPTIPTLPVIPNVNGITSLLVDTMYLVKIIVGAVVGAQFLAALIFFLVWFCKRRTRLSKLKQVFNTSSNAQISYNNLNNTTTEQNVTY
jgi:hypothetical protein